VMMEIWDDCATKIGMGAPSELRFVYLVLDAENYMRGSCDDSDEGGIGRLVVVDLEVGDRIIFLMCPQPCGTAQRCAAK